MNRPKGYFVDNTIEGYCLGPYLQMCKLKREKKVTLQITPYIKGYCLDLFLQMYKLKRKKRY